MQNKLLVRFICGACAALLLTSCGNSKSSGTGEFATVVASATAIAGTLDSDVAVWVDSTGGKAPACGASSIPTIIPDDVVFSILSTPFTSPSTGSTSPIATSNLSISSVTLTFTPADSATPALPARFQTQFASASPSLIVPGTNSVTVRIVTDPMKAFLQSALACTGLIYTYRVTVSYDMVEINTNRSNTVNLSGNGFLTVTFADFTDK